MTRQETLTLMTILKAAYPSYYKGMSRSDADDIVNLWAEMFADDDVSVVALAVKSLINADEKGFPPHIGAVKAYMRKITEPVGMSEMEAWALVKRAITTGASMESYSRELGGDGRTSAQRKYDSLPKDIQAVIGGDAYGAQQLAAWAMLTPNEVDTVIASNFQRSYRARVQSNKEYAALPDAAKMLIYGLASKMALTEGEPWENEQH